MSAELQKSISYFVCREKYLGWAELFANHGLISEDGKYYRNRKARFLKEWRKSYHGIK